MCLGFVWFISCFFAKTVCCPLFSMPSLLFTVVWLLVFTRMKPVVGECVGGVCYKKKKKKNLLASANQSYDMRQQAAIMSGNDGLCVYWTLPYWLSFSAVLWCVLWCVSYNDRLKMQTGSEQGMLTFFSALSQTIDLTLPWCTHFCVVMTPTAPLLAHLLFFFLFSILFAQQCHSSSGGRGGRQARFDVTCAASPSATRLTCSVTRCSMRQCGMSTFVMSVRGPSLGRVASRDTSVTCTLHWPVALERNAAKIRLVRMALSPMWGDILVALTGCVSLLCPAEWCLVEPLLRHIDIEC